MHNYGKRFRPGAVVRNALRRNGALLRLTDADGSVAIVLCRDYPWAD